jgi:hypothetical protein
MISTIKSNRVSSSCGPLVLSESQRPCRNKMSLGVATDGAKSIAAPRLLAHIATL